MSSAILRLCIIFSLIALQLYFVLFVIMPGDNVRDEVLRERLMLPNELERVVEKVEDSLVGR